MTHFGIFWHPIEDVCVTVFFYSRFPMMRPPKEGPGLSNKTVSTSRNNRRFSRNIAAVFSELNWAVNEGRFWGAFDIKWERESSRYDLGNEDLF